MRLTAKFDGLGEVRRQLVALAAGPRLALAQTAEDVEDFAAAAAAKHTRTGAMVRALYLRPFGADGWEVGHDPNVAKHTMYVHWGSKAHKIKPKRKRVLRWPAGGKFAFAQGVNHPGYKGDPWMVRAAAQAPMIFERHLQARLAKG